MNSSEAVERESDFGALAVLKSQGFGPCPSPPASQSQPRRMTWPKPEFPGSSLSIQLKHFQQVECAGQYFLASARFNPPAARSSVRAHAVALVILTLAITTAAAAAGQSAAAAILTLAILCLLRPSTSTRG